MLQIKAQIIGEYFNENKELYQVTQQLEALRPLVINNGSSEVKSAYLEAENRYFGLISELINSDGNIVVTKTVDNTTWILVIDRKREEEGGYFFPDWPDLEDLTQDGIESMVGMNVELKPVLNADFSDPLNDPKFVDEVVAMFLTENESQNGGGAIELHKSEITDIQHIFDEIEQTASVNEKISIVKANSDNSLFKDILSFVYDDFIKTGMSFKSLNEYNDNGIVVSDYQGDYTLKSLMEYVKTHNTGTLNTLGLIHDFGSLFDDDTKQFIYKVFSNELKVGITAKSVNKALGSNFIKQFAVQLAHPYHKYVDKVVGKDFALTQKLDGHRAICIVNNGNANFFTRKGLPIHGLTIQELEAIDLVRSGFNEDSRVLDGELVLRNDEELETKDLFRATSRILRNEKANKSNILFNIFDSITLEEFEEGESHLPFANRKDDLKNAFEVGKSEGWLNETGCLRLVKDIYRGNDINKISQIQKELVEPLGWEGLMLNMLDGKYVTKRTSNLLKIKEFFAADVVVKDVFEGTGKLQNRLGGVIIDYKGYEIKVGSGFTLDERDKFWSDPSLIIGKVIEINYFEETHNQNNSDISLRFPTFVCVREDKDVRDVSYEI